MPARLQVLLDLVLAWRQATELIVAGGVGRGRGNLAAAVGKVNLPAGQTGTVAGIGLAASDA